MNNLVHIEDKYRLIRSGRNNKFNPKLGFIEAAITTATGIFKRRIEDGVLTDEGVKKLLDEYLPGYIYSTGLYMTTNRKNTEKQKEGILNGKAKEYFMRDILAIKDSKFLDKQPLLLDSAGHQVIMGYLPLDNALIWTENYFKFVHETDEIDFAFSLDIHADIPTPGFTHPQILWDVNCKSCDNMFSTLDDESLKKIIWVLQFKGKLLNLWDALHNKYDIFKKINKFAIGGVAQGNNTQTVSYPLYMIPAALIIHGIKNNLWADYYLLHILGVMAPTDFLQFAVIQQCAERFHGINLQVSNDGSSILRGQSASASFRFFLGKTSHKISFKSGDLNKRIESIPSLTNEQLIKKIVKLLSDQYGFKDITDEPIYIDDKLNQKYWSFIILASYIYYSNLQNFAVKTADELLTAYQKGDRILFDQILQNYLITLNSGRVTRNLHNKMKNYWDAIEMLEELNIKTILETNTRVFPNLRIFDHGDLNIPEEYMSI